MLIAPLILIGKAIAEAVLEEVEAVGLDMKNCRGQAYDGAAAMSGAENGAAQLIRNKYPLAVYQHCKSHCLNLAIMKAATIIPQLSESSCVQ